MALEKEELMLLGKIDGKLDGIGQHLNRQDARMDAMEKRQDARMDAMEAKMEAQTKGLDSRLRKVEQRAAVYGAFSGSAVSIGVALAIEGIKQYLRGNGGPGLGN